MIRSWKQILFITVIVSLGCDPGITIRQVDGEQANDSRLRIQVPISRPLIGENWYAPGNVTATNLTQSSVTITAVQLVSANRSYEYRQVGSTKYPVTLAPGETVTIPIWFDLDSGVSGVFKNKVELRVNYEDNIGKGVSSAFLVGGPLD